MARLTGKNTYLHEYRFHPFSLSLPTCVCLYVYIYFFITEGMACLMGKKHIYICISICFSLFFSLYMYIHIHIYMFMAEVMLACLTGGPLSTHLLSTYLPSIYLHGRSQIFPILSSALSSVNSEAS